MFKRNLLILTLCVPLLVSAEEQPKNPNQKFLEHMNKIMELSRQQQEKCLKATKPEECAYSEEFTQMLQQLSKSMGLNSDAWPSDYFENLLKQGPHPNMEEMIKQYQELLRPKQQPQSQEPAKSETI